MKYKYILFDFDGTVINSEEGVTKCSAYALSCFGIDEKPENLRHFIGPPLHYSFSHYYNMSDDECDKAVAKFRERYKDKGMFECSLYSGIAECLKELKSLGAHLAVATSKYEPFALKISDNLNISESFDVLTGASYDMMNATKKDIIELTLEKLGVTDKSLAVMVGDTQYDILGAKQAGIDSIGVTYGFGSEASLRDSGADYVVNSTEELSSLLKCL